MRDRADRVDYVCARSALHPHRPLPAAVPRADALQLGRRAVRPGPRRIRRRQAPAPSAGLHPLRRRWRGWCNGWIGDAAGRLRPAGRRLQRRWHLRRLPAARAVYDRPTALAAADAARGEPAVLVLRLGGAHLRGRGAVRLDRRLLRVPALRGSEPDAWLAAGYLGLAGGLRQSLLLLLFPLWLVAVVRGRAPAARRRSWDWRSSGRRARLVRADDLADRRARAISSRPRASSPTRWCKPTSIVGGPRRGHAADVALPAGIRAGRRSARWPWRSPCWLPWYVRHHGWGRREWFLVLWTVPPVLVYTLVHFGQAGYVLTFLPALVILLVARAAGGAGRRRRAGAERAGPRRDRRRRGHHHRRRQRRLLRQRAAAAARLRHAQVRLAPDGRGRGVRLDLQPHRGRAARARGGRWPDLRGGDPRALPVRGHRDRHRARQHALVSRGCVTRCSTCPEYAIYELRVGDVAPGLLRAAAGVGDDAGAGQRRGPAGAASSDSCGSSTTGARPPSGRRVSWRSRFRTAATSTCCRWAAGRWSYAGYTLRRYEAR